MSFKLAMQSDEFNNGSSNDIVEYIIDDLKRAEERADKDGWIDADDLEKELRV